ncbi:MAG: YlbF family regulator, partial [Eubacteriales bacterium]
MDYIPKARELGEALLNTPQFQALKEAENTIQQDDNTSKAFQEYQEKERNLLSSQMFGKIIPEKESLALIDLKVRLMSKYPTIRKFFNLQQEFERVMAIVNLTITTTIYGIPSVDQLPFPDEIKGLAGQILDNINGDNKTPTMEIPSDFKLPGNFSLSVILRK